MLTKMMAKSMVKHAAAAQEAAEKFHRETGKMGVMVAVNPITGKPHAFEIGDFHGWPEETGEDAA